MRVDHAYDHHNAVAEWERRELYDWLSDVFEAPGFSASNMKCNTCREVMCCDGNELQTLEL